MVKSSLCYITDTGWLNSTASHIVYFHLDKIILPIAITQQISFQILLSIISAGEISSNSNISLKETRDLSLLLKPVDQQVQDICLIWVKTRKQRKNKSVIYIIKKLPYDSSIII